MPCRLRPGLSFCLIEGRAIFFDLPRGRYFALPSKLEDAFERIRHIRPGDPIDDADLDRLCRAGILEGTADAVLLPSGERQASGTSDRAEAVAAARTGLTLIIEMIVAQMLVTILLRLQPIQRVLALLERHADRRSAGSAHPTTVDRLAAAAVSGGMLLRTEGQCLPRTLAFVWRCRRRGYRAKLVIGVRINPFAAHCWAQHDDVVLNDVVDRTSLFEPIFVL